MCVPNGTLFPVYCTIFDMGPGQKYCTIKGIRAIWDVTAVFLEVIYSHFLVFIYDVYRPSCNNEMHGDSLGNDLQVVCPIPNHVLFV